MERRKLVFPDRFLWGAATASHQNEGNNSNNDFWEWEKMPGHVIDGTTSALACDWWNRAEEDFDRAAALGLGTLRLSLEWSRIEPEADRWDDAAIDRYRAMLKALRERHIEPMVTLHHFTNPLWLARRGGWAEPSVVPSFARYVEKAVESLQDLCRIWCTINEPIVYAAHAYILGKWSPGEKSFARFVRVVRHQIEAHTSAHAIIHELQPEAEVGVAKHMAVFDPANPESRKDRWAASLRDKWLNWRFLDATMRGKIRFPFGSGLGIYRRGVGSNDFLGINYYGRHPLRFDSRRAGAMFASEVQAPPEIAWPAPWTDREIYPHGLYRFLKRMAGYGKPIYVTENGMADAEDRIRPAFLLTHLAAMHRAIQEGVNVKGFYHWTLVDNYEWVEGWTTRFGLIALDPKTQERTARPSAEMYREIATGNAITEELVEKYAPQAMDQVFGKSI